MENSYGIGVKNRYELFYDDDEDPVELLRQQEEEKEKRKAEKISAKDKPKGAKSAKAPANATTKKITKEIPVTKSQDRGAVQRDDNNKLRTTRPDRAVKFASGPRDDQREFEERKNRRNREDRASGTGSETRFDSNRDRGEGDVRRGGRGGGTGRGTFRGRGRGGAPGRGFDGRGKREFDRQSGSDRSSVKPVDKKGGEGQYNWGTLNDDLEMQLSPFGGEETAPGDTSALDKSGEEPSGDGAADASKEEGGDAADDEAAAAAAAAREMTLDEYKREQEQKRSRARFNIRKPGEGEENAQWKKMYVLKKKVTEPGEEEEEEEEDEEVSGSEDDDEYARRGRQRQLVDIEINFADARRSRGGGRGRGPGRGGRPGGGERGGGPGRFPGRDAPTRGEGGGGGGGTPKQSAPKVDDWNDFPSLVTA